jgi:hypothetical protein
MFGGLVKALDVAYVEHHTLSSGMVLLIFFIYLQLTCRNRIAAAVSRIDYDVLAGIIPFEHGA